MRAMARARAITWSHIDLPASGVRTRRLRAWLGSPLCVGLALLYPCALVVVLALAGCAGEVGGDGSGGSGDDGMGSGNGSGSGSDTVDDPCANPVVVPLVGRPLDIMPQSRLAEFAARMPCLAPR